MQERVTYLESTWLYDRQYHTVTFLNYYGDIHEQLTVKHGEYLDYTPVHNSYVAIFNGWQHVKTGKTYISTLPILEDAVYEPQWIDVNLLLENGIAMSDINIEDVDVDALKALIDKIENSSN